MRFRRSRSAPLGAAAVTALLLIGAGCGIPTESEPVALTDATSTTAPQPSVTGTIAMARLYLSSGATGDPLVAVERGLDSRATPTSVLEALLQSPTEAEAADGLTTLIPVETTLIAAELDDANDLLTVEFSEDQWQTLQGDTAVGAYAQVVLTATTVDGVSRVTFVLDGAIIGAPTPGAGTKDVVTRRDYRTLDPDR